MARLVGARSSNVIKQNPSRTTTASEINEELALMELRLSIKTRSLIEKEKRNIQKKPKTNAIPCTKCDITGGGGGGKCIHNV